MCDIHCIFNIWAFYSVCVVYVCTGACVCTWRGQKLTSDICLYCPSLGLSLNLELTILVTLAGWQAPGSAVLGLGFRGKCCAQLLRRWILYSLIHIPSRPGFPFYILKVKSMYHSYHPKWFKIASSIHFRIRRGVGRCLRTIF